MTDHTLPDQRALTTAIATARRAGAAYADGESPLTDSNYDALVHAIATTCRHHPDWDDDGFLTEIAPGSARGEYTHSTPMTSLRKLWSTQDIAAFLSRLACPANVELKLDGIALAAHYRDGHLVRALTRGDGHHGENITATLLTGPGINGLPRRLTCGWSGEIRGELYMSYTDFAAVNTWRHRHGEPPFATPRSAAAGTARNRDTTAQAPLSFAAYALTPTEHDSHLAAMRTAEQLGLTTTTNLTAEVLPSMPPLVTAAAEVQARLCLDAARRSLTYPTDGLVLTADSYARRAALGTSSTSPRWAAACKFTPADGTTTVRDIEPRLTRGGKLSLRANLDPVVLDGVTVRRALLPGPDWIRTHHLHIGATVAVVRTGDVWPRITEVMRHTAAIFPWRPPAKCPQCHGPWEITPQGWYCRTPGCGVEADLLHAASKDNYNLPDFGPHIAAALTNSGLVEHVGDLLHLSAAQITEARYDSGRTLGPTVAATLHSGIATARERPLPVHLAALGIPSLGRTTARRIAEHFGDLAAIREASVTDVSTVPGIGPVRARDIVNGLHHRAAALERMLNAGIPTTYRPHNVTHSALTGRKVVFTGDIPGLNRADAHERAHQLGATVTSTISTTVDVLIVGSNPGPFKLTRAQELGIPTMPGIHFQQI